MTDIAISLSGGGFRAVLFHLGVIGAIRAMNRMSDIRLMSCVSGGSLTGAFTVLNWSSFAGSDSEFEAAADRLIAFAKADVRGKIIRRLPAPRYYTFERLLDGLFDTALLTDVDDGNRPRLILNTTDLKHGTAAAFAGRRFIPDVRQQSKPSIDVGPFSLAQAVSCSAGFPALFPAKEITNKHFAQRRKEFEHGASLADGGIYDNLGVQFFLGMPPAELPEELIISDAGAPFDYQDGLIGNVVRRAIRISDVQMALLQSSSLGDRLVSDTRTTHFISIGDEAAGSRRGRVVSSIPSEIVRQLQFIRTDFDAFSDLEIDYLIRHGYESTIRRLGDPDIPPQNWRYTHPKPRLDGEAIADNGRTLVKASRRRLGLFRSDDKFFWLPWAIVASIGGVVIASIAVLAPFVTGVIRGPIVDGFLTGQPYRVTSVTREVVLRDVLLEDGVRGISSTSRIFYALRLNKNVSVTDLTFPENFVPTFFRAASARGLGVAGGQAVRESPGTPPYQYRQEVTFAGNRGDAIFVATGIAYDFDWPGPTRSLKGVGFRPDEDYWAYDNKSDYIDKLTIIVESRSDSLTVTPTPACAILLRGDLEPDAKPCLEGEALPPYSAGHSALPAYGGALVAEFKDLRPGDSAIIKYTLRQR